MDGILNYIHSAKRRGEKLLAILLDPDKIDWDSLSFLAEKIKASPATHLFVGGSQVSSSRIDELVGYLRQYCNLPVILFPGHPSQISKAADGILLLSLLSGRNPDYLIGHHVVAAPILAQTTLEIIPTGYLLLGDAQTAVARVSQTNPIPFTSVDEIVHTALAAQMLGHQLVYLEAGSGAPQAVPAQLISAVSAQIHIPLIVGGGIRNAQSMLEAYAHGADLVVIGTAFENDPNFFDQHATVLSRLL